MDAQQRHIYILLGTGQDEAQAKDRGKIVPFHDL
jgi:hypothetical protein